ncbi:MAG: MFS transporter [Actinobacteria bacterium]|nr:MFS transporter [Actinomycetota bacterium]
MVGLERTVVPLMAGPEFGVQSAVVTMSFIAAFGATKALANFLAGWLADRRGRRRLLIVGWLVALPVPVLLGLAPAWGWVVVANLLLGANQGLCWTMTLVMMSDIAGRPRRGMAIGVNESTGYVAIAVAALASVPLAEAYGARSTLAAGGLVVALGGLLLSRHAHETLDHARSAGPGEVERLDVRWRTLPARILVPRRDPQLAACYQAGLVTKINDAGVWGLVPLALAARGLPVGHVALVAGVYPLVWGLGQGLTGAMSDVVNRRPLIGGGMLIQAAGLATLATTSDLVLAVGASATMGLGTAFVYPTLLAAVRDIARGRWEASAFGAYRLWRDAGFVVGALGGGALAETASMTVALVTAAVVTAASGAATYVLLPRRLATLDDALVPGSAVADPADGPA